MSEYISRNEVYQKLHEAGGCDASDEWARGYDAGITEAIEIIDKISPADVAPVVHGHWEEGSDDGIWWTYLKCSVCEGEGYDNFRFCPHCGAKMDESEDNDNA